MISVPSHRQLLNGSKLISGGVVLLFWVMSCSPKTNVPIKKNPQVATKPKGDTLISKENVSKPDTIVWTDISKDNPPVTDVSPKSAPDKTPKTSARSILKKRYNVKLLIPLNSTKYQPVSLASNRFVQFYSGALLALQDLEKAGVSLNVLVEDTGSPDYSLLQVCEKGEFGDWDAVIGPFERDDVKYVANEAAKKGITLISPWQTSTKIARENEYYIQLKPNLKEHFQKLVEHACTQFGAGKVVVITHQNQEGNAWFQFMSDVSKKFTGIDNYIKHFPVSNDSLSANNTAFVNLFKENAPNAVILPYYSFADESNLYSVLRRLNIDKKSQFLTVYGMPLMIDSDRIDFEYYSSLHCRIAISDFVDDNDYRVKQFKRRFFEEYGELADNEALKGYDVFTFIGKNLKNHGNFFQEVISGESQKYLQSEIRLMPSSADENEMSSGQKIDYYENKNIWIIEFKSSGFQVIE